jgi:hypothetical protein
VFLFKSIASFYKKLAQILASFALTTASFCKSLIITCTYEKNAIFSPNIGKKSQKTAIITSTPERRILISASTPHFQLSLETKDKVLHFISVRCAGADSMKPFRQNFTDKT